MEGPYQIPSAPGAPPPMPEPPRMPRGRLWASLLAPPFATGASLGLVVLLDQAHALSGNDWIPWLLMVVTGAVMLVSLIQFILLVSRRYIGGSIALLILGYLVGQAVVCFAVFFGGCLLLMAGSGF
ncbi:hypothetical protein llg_12360 [Luteolibacter sp. LG18]|nr:hypothetical protein llg_12360 [Luteolibacter sp. LG18]